MLKERDCLICSRKGLVVKGNCVNLSGDLLFYCENCCVNYSEKVYKHFEAKLNNFVTLMNNKGEKIKFKTNSDNTLFIFKKENK